jgi:hypothetical protein
MHRFGELAEVAPIAFVNPIVDFSRIYDVDVLDVLNQHFADALGDVPRGTGVAILMRRWWPTDDDDPLALQRVALGGRDYPFPHVDAVARIAGQPLDGNSVPTASSSAMAGWVA